MTSILRKGSCGRCCALAALSMVAAVLWTQPAWALLDYARSVGADFQTDSGGSPFGGLPTSNPFGPNGEWAFRGSNGAISGLIKSGGMPASGQAGWCDSTDGVSCTSGGPFTYSANSFWQPGQTIHPGVMGHGPHDTLWTAPASIDEGAVTIVGSMEQIFEPTREMRLSIFKNSDATPFFFIDAIPPIVNGVILQPVNFGPITVPIVPGDKLNFRIFPSASPPPPNAGVPTFVNWNVTLTESVIPEPASAMLLAVGGLLVGAVVRRHR
jgi:hypothetical protein